MKLPQNLFDLDCVLRNVFVLIGVFVLGFGAGVWQMYYYTKPGWEQYAAKTAIYAYQMQAVKQGFGSWEHDANGAPEFAWRGAKCTALGMEK